MKKDCFAYAEFVDIVNNKVTMACRTLEKLDCENCKFYKTREKYKEQLSKLKGGIYEEDDES